MLGNENAREKVENSILCIRLLLVEWTRSAEQNWQDSACLGASAGFASHRWCNPGLVTFSPWPSVSLFFLVLISSCLSCSVGAMLGKTKMNNTIFVKCFSAVIQSHSRIGFVLSKGSCSLCDCSDLLLLWSSHASLWLDETEESGAIELNATASRDEQGRNIERLKVFFFN